MYYVDEKRHNKIYRIHNVFCRIKSVHVNQKSSNKACSANLDVCSFSISACLWSPIAHVKQCNTTSALLLIMPRLPHYEMRAGVCPSVCQSVRRTPRPNSRTERPKKPKIGTMEAHHMNNLWTYLEVKRSKVKVTRPINAVNNTDNEKSWTILLLLYVL